MSGPARIAAFVLVIVVVFAGAALAGTAVSPETNPSHGGGDHGADAAGEQPAAEHGAEGAGEHAEGAAGPPPGLAIAEGGYRLELQRTRFAAGEPARLDFRIVDDRGAAVTDFATEHDRRMHLIVVRRDLRRFQHVHPRQGDDGTWSVRLTLPEAGTYRAFADFRVGDAKHTLGADLVVPGDVDPLELPPAASVAEVDGYEVRLDAATNGELGFTVQRDGRPVTGLEDYLGAKGHLVALREGDLAYLHTHPEPDALRFEAEYPSAGRYRLFVQFQHEGTVRTAAFTQEVTP